jgi:hypothetical protein
MNTGPVIQPTRQPSGGEINQPPSPKRLLIVAALAVFPGEFLIMLILAVPRSTARTSSCRCRPHAPQWISL